MIAEQQSFSTRARDVPPTNGHLRCAPRLDDPHFVDERERAATPPHLYERTLREALRLTPIGESFCFERTGLLAHPHMLGPNDVSYECASSKDYGAFLRAYQNGEVKRLTVVARLSQEPRQVGRFASYAMISTANLFGALPSALRRRKAVGPDPVSVVSFLLGIRRLARALAFESAPKRSATVYNPVTASRPTQGPTPR
jgi:hypothetical protein